MMTRTDWTSAVFRGQFLVLVLSIMLLTSHSGWRIISPSPSNTGVMAFSLMRMKPSSTFVGLRPLMLRSLGKGRQALLSSSSRLYPTYLSCPLSSLILRNSVDSSEDIVNVPSLDDSDESSSSSLFQLRSVTFANLPKTRDDDDDDNNDDKQQSLLSLDPNLLCDFLMELGACSTSITDADAGTPDESPLFREGISSDNINFWHDSVHWAAPLWNRCNVTAHFPPSIDLDEVWTLVQQTFWGVDASSSLPVEVEAVPDRDWVVHVQSSWNPIVLSCPTSTRINFDSASTTATSTTTFVLRFPWHSDEHVQHAIANQSNHNPNDAHHDANTIELQLQGGIAFGTGEHATTQLCLEWLAQVAPQQFFQGENSTHTLWVLDYGTGSGILGMAACRLWEEAFPVRVVGIDIDVDACRIANENALHNGPVPMHSYLPPLLSSDDVSSSSSSPMTSGKTDQDSKALLLKAVHREQQKQQQQQQQQQDDNVDDTSSSLFLPLSLHNQRYHIVVANILAGPLVVLAPTLVAQLEPGGVLGMSGILDQESTINSVLDAYIQAGLEQVQVAERRNGWVLVTGQRPQ